MKIAIIEVNSCQECPHLDDIGRCMLLDHGVWKGCKASDWGIRDDCPLPDPTTPTNKS